MNKNNKIINEKLNSIDHKLNVEELWAQLEPQLPPAPSAKKRPVFWFWSGMIFSILLVGFLTWNFFGQQESQSEESTSVSTTSLIDNNQSAAEEIQNTTPIASNEASITTNNVAEKETANRATKIEESSSQRSASGERAKSESSQSKLESKNEVSSNIAISKQYTKASTELQNSVQVADQNGNEKSLSTQLHKQLENQENDLLGQFIENKKEQKSNADQKPMADQSVGISPATNINLSIANLVDEIADIEFERTLDAIATYANLPQPLVKPRVSPARWRLAALYNYGTSLGTSTYGDVVQSNVAIEGEDSRGAEHIDVMGAELRLGYAITKKMIINAGLSYLKTSDKITKTEELGTDIMSLADGGYQISNTKYVAVAYDASTIVDVNFGLSYNFQWGRFGLQPEGGVTIGLIHDRTKKAIARDLDSFEEQLDNLNYNSTSSSEKIQSGFYLRLATSYAVTKDFDVIAGLKYLPSRTTDGIEDKSFKVNSMIVGQVGLSYRF